MSETIGIKASHTRAFGSKPMMLLSDGVLYFALFEMFLLLLPSVFMS